MFEFDRNSTIKELINSQKPLKALGWMLSIRDTTIKEVFNGLGYVYDKKSKQWLNENENYQGDWTFQQALEHVRPWTRKPKVKEENNKYVKTDSDLSVEVLNAIGLPDNELPVLKKMIIECMQQGLIEVNVIDISDEVSKLNASRKRKNRTFYISEDVIKDIADIANKSNVKVSQIVEVALIEMLAKYKTSINIKINRN